MTAAAEPTKRFLEPYDRISEILFGLIMVLTFTGSLSVAESGRADVRLMLIGALGCNIAWGIIDGALYLTGSVFSRNQRVQFVRRLRATKTEAEAMEAIRGEFGLEDEPPLGEADRSVFHRVVLDIMRRAPVGRARLRGQDWMAALIIAVLVALTAVPGMLPFLFVENGYLALRLANLIQVALLFYVGWHWARYTGSSPWRAALMILALGIALVVVAVALGG